MGEKILVVGSGGIGCELLKLLAIDRTNDIVVIDDDTIDYSNLNRQFLFVKKDVDCSKAVTAAAKLQESGEGSLKIKGICSKINEFKDIEWYKQFDIVYNCLDNNETRSFVNQRCHAAGIPLVDGGSAEWLGQSFFNGAECFDCLPKKTDKIFPVCTIRQKPTKFEHCLVWAESQTESDDDAGVKRVKIQEEAETDKIYEMACARAAEFNIKPMTLLESETFLKRIVPSISTTNALVASLMVITRQTKRNYFLVQGRSIFLPVDLHAPNKNCITCGIPTYICKVNPETKICDFLEKFGGTTLIHEENTYEFADDTRLQNFNHEFMLCLKNDYRYRIYFELDPESTEIAYKRIR
ncbi:ubiquitin-like 1-activating enzyme E1 B [Enteropsectra breve]|nr:ubiquitin-like 1-activating enzyme E1 B [Enteropsectra breve]